MKQIRRLNFETLFWLTAILLLALSNSQEHHFTLCPIANMGFENWCPGCGLGRSIGDILHGRFIESFHHHWFGFPALLIIIYRVYTLLKGKKVIKISTTNT
ncbi:DUF2752 domain-containing protein [Pedobacter sp. AW1-32]|uniref:DUF2752 domain-containing protein n=1 Tax=Pedobacter sp. AW1-32 TaxID=3383026 RepID=UPI003FEE91D9